ncbi:MAG: RNase adapter RapZ [Actinomycetota bacterium]|mgnify:FL=1|jgi:RNase adapter protein RapZ|tara:strand:- start:6553 stop:7428 length:876 start_codon:yes stop_codon:yes gene_type:complete
MSSNEVLVITGMSGAGKSTVAHALEDLGWYVVDNLPPSMVSTLFEIAVLNPSTIAVVIDVRGGEFFDDLSKSLADLGDKNIAKRIIFIDASDESLVRRFEATRRPHPLQGSDRILDGIQRERERLQEIRSAADLVIDSSSLNVHQLESRINEIFSESSDTNLRVNILSFGYKYGIPVDADLVMDCRFIANPHWNPELRPLTGLDSAVSENVLANSNVQEFLTKYQSLFETMAEGFMHEGRKYLTLAVGCTGGKHRSVAISEELAKRFTNSESEISKKIKAQAVHRDLGREI